MTTRRDFLRGRISARPAPQRPPWALAEAAFLAACTRCGDCLRACPTGIIVALNAEGGYPQIEFRKGECTFCAACVAACKPGALARAEGQPWRLLPEISGACLARRDIVCRSCGDACPHAAIRFSPRAGGSALPEVEASRCTGCGGCVAPCPASAIAMK